MWYIAQWGKFMVPIILSGVNFRELRISLIRSKKSTRTHFRRYKFKFNRLLWKYNQKKLTRHRHHYFTCAFQRYYFQTIKSKKKQSFDDKSSLFGVNWNFKYFTEILHRRYNANWLHQQHNILVFAYVRYLDFLRKRYTEMDSCIRSGFLFFVVNT